MADDATIIASDEESLLKALNILKEAGKKNYLELSKEKTKIMKIRGPSTTEKRGEFNIEKEVKYLGIQLGGRGKDIFGAENKIWIKKAERKANELIGQVKSSCDMVVVGKAIWKMMVIPTVLYGRVVIPTNEADITKLQIIENRVWRYLLGIGG